MAVRADRGGWVMSKAMSEAELQGFRERLESWREEITADLARELEASEEERYIDLAGRVGDLEDQALADLLVDENLIAIHRHVHELRELDAAIARIERGEYGECIDCGEPIPPERLEAYPSAMRCIDCQAAYERTHAQEGHPTL